MSEKKSASQCGASFLSNWFTAFKISAKMARVLGGYKGDR